MTTVAIVQARMTSSRLPGKVLADVAGRPMLARVVERARAARSLDRVVVAATDRPADDPVADWCAAAGVDCFRGDETDVLGRFAGAARAFGADVVVRLTADCPLLDPAVIDRVVGELLDHPGTDYASNVTARSYPRGLDVEAFTAAALGRMDQLGRSAAAREHVTVPVRLERPDAFAVRQVRSPEDDSDLRWTVDTAADLEFVRLVYQHFGPGRTDYRDLVRWCRDHPDWIRHDEAGHTWDPSRPAAGALAKDRP